MMRPAIATVLSFLVFVSPALAQIDDLQDHVVVGVRTDAAPFVWWDKDTKWFDGFIYDLCLKAVTHAGYMPTFVKVDSKARTEFLKTGAGEYDLLCDPTTLTLSRAMHFAEYAKSGSNSLGALHFSPIYFVANGGHVELKDSKKNAGKGVFQFETEKLRQANSCEKAVEKVRGRPETGQEEPLESAEKDKTFMGSIENWLNANVQLRHNEKIKSPQTDVSVWGYVRGTSIEKRVFLDRQERAEDTTVVCVHVFDSHAEAADWFCDGYLARYYGDLDIIRESVSDASEPKSACEYKEPTEQRRTYEPYAFVVSSGRHPDFPNKFAAALYALFHNNIVQDDHAASFPNVNITTYLNTLFLINKVPSGESGGAAVPMGDE